MKNTATLVPEIRSLAELRKLAERDARYEWLACVASSNLGGPPNATPKQALRWLYLNADETSERGVVDEVNFCRDLI